jgi:glutamate-5-semialdehyde dehydrogenase
MKSTKFWALKAAMNSCIAMIWSLPPKPRHPELGSGSKHSFSLFLSFGLDPEINSPMTDSQTLITELGQAARAAYRTLATASAADKNQALRTAASELRTQTPALLAANAQDMAFGREKGLSDAMLDRLALNDARIEAMAKGLEAIADLPDPVGKDLAAWDGPNNGLHIQKITVPLGVIGIIYESRPNVTADAGALCLKSGNAAILRGGSESLYSSGAIVACLHAGLRAANLPEAAIQMIPTRDRAAVGAMLTATGLIDVIVPRGGLSLTQRVAQESRVPTILHLDGNCHTYVHKSADEQTAVDVIFNAKLRRTGICGATESIVIDEAIVDSVLPKIVSKLMGGGCEVVGDNRAQAADERINAATDDDWGTEYLAAKVSVKTVSGLHDAITHINHYSSHHTDCIIAQDAAAQQQFSAQIDSAIVMINSSTQFADGGEFGMGAEIGISTGRLHARGPVGCDQLVTYKYIVTSDGATRA